jgi:DNA mismatch repair protein MutS2
MNEKELYTDLEYSRLIEEIDTRCESYLGKERAQQLKPLEERETIEESLELVSELQEMLNRGITLNFNVLSNLQPLFTEAQHSLFGFEEFQQVYFQVCLAEAITDTAERVKDFPVLKKLWQKVESLPKIKTRFEKIFDSDGEVMDSASQELNRIRKRFASLQRNIQKTMQNMLNDSRYENFLQDKFITRREGRYVLPVKGNAGTFVPGIVQGQSGSGSTLFIEPENVVPLNNELQLLLQEEKREIFNIFSEFTAQIREQKDILLSNQEVLTELDYRFACAKLCCTLKANKPLIVDEPVLKLYSARHPLLILSLNDIEKVVPFDLDLGEKVKVILLSGPNTGGKTVLLKATGLLTLMALSGLPIPAEENSVIGRFDQVFADIGDEQSIENALSTFSSHIGKIARMLKCANNKSLVLIDEIGAATDPQQGSALAQAILEHLTELGTKALVTTHYTALKIFAETHPDCMNASMQFDLKSLTPTFRFNTGIPGDSFAIEVAYSLGLKPDLIERAKELSGSQNIEFTELLKKMHEEKKALSIATYEYELKTRNLESKLQEMESREAALNAELKERRKKYLQELQTELIAQQKLYQREQESLKKMEKKERKAVSERKLQDINIRLQEINKELTDSEIKQKQKIRIPQQGDRVWLATLGTEVTILEIKEELVKVDLNGITFKTSLDSLYEIEQPVKKKENVVITHTNKPPNAQFELKLLGLTFEEAKPLIDEFLDDAMLAGLHTLRIVHGKGTGALRTKVRDYLKKKKQVISMETPIPSEGGTGVTLVKI